MRTAKSMIALMAFCALAANAIAQTAQPSQPQRWMTISYLSMDSDKREQFEKYLAGDAKKIVQSRIDSGEILAWIAMKFLSPWGADAPYMYTVGTTWASHPMLDPDPATMDKHYAKAGTTRAAWNDLLKSMGVRVVKREQWRTIDRVGEWAAAGDFMRLDFVKAAAGSGPEYTAMERSVMKPLWAAGVQKGRLKAWNLMWIAAPTGENEPATHTTVRVYKDEAQMFDTQGGGEAAFKEVHPDRNYISTFNQVPKLRTLVSGQIARVVSVVRAPQQQASAR